jgi:hypothetical protein
MNCTETNLYINSETVMVLKAAKPAKPKKKALIKEPKVKKDLRVAMGIKDDHVWNNILVSL